MADTINTVLRLPPEIHEKIRWLAFKERRSQHKIILEILENALGEVVVPEDIKK